MQSYDDLEHAIARDYKQLSRRLQQVARYALEHPTDMAFEKVAVIAERAGVQPSTLIRFAKAFGYSGFSEMQRIFRTRLTEHAPSYAERLRRLRVEGSPEGDPMQVLGHFVDAGHHALDHLVEEVSAETLERALAALSHADTIYVVAQRRAYPVAAYFAYALGHLGLRVNLLDGTGGMSAQQATGLRGSDALLAVSFHPYGEETCDAVRIAAERGAEVIAITDSPLSPIAGFGGPVFEVQDAEVQSFRSLTATMALAIALVVSLGQRLGIDRTAAQ